MTTVERYGSGGPWEATFGYSRAIAAGPLVLTAGCTATVDGAVVHPGDAAAQARVAFGIALDAIAKAGASVHDVVRTRMYVVRAEDCDAVGRVHGELFGDVRPAATMVIVAKLIDPDHLVEVEVEAYRPERGVSASEPRSPGQAQYRPERGVSASEPRSPGQAQYQPERSGPGPGSV